MKVFRTTSMGVAEGRWPAHRLKRVASINDEALAETVDPDWELDYIDIGNVTDAGQIVTTARYTFEKAPSRARRIVRDGDVIISTVRTYLKAVAPIVKPPENLIVSTGFAVVRPGPTLVSRFAFYALQAEGFILDVVAQSLGISYPAITSERLGTIPLMVPDESMQERIASYLDQETVRIDELVVEKERMLELLKEKRSAGITHAVTRGIDPKAKMKPSGVAWLGDIPEGWQVRRVAYLFKERDEREMPHFPLLNVSLNTGVTVREFAEDRIERTAEDFATYKVARKGDVSFNKMRMWQGAVGIAPVDGLVSPDYVVAEPGLEVFPPYFGYLLRIPAFSAEAARRSHGIVWDRLRLYWDDFRDMQVPLPPLVEQKAIVAEIEKEVTEADELAAAHRDSIRLLGERRTALITAAVTGKICGVEAMNMCDKPKVTIADQIHGTVVWVEAAGYETARHVIEALGAECHDAPGEPGFRVIKVKNELGHSIDKNNIKSPLEDCEDLDFIDFDDAKRLRDQALKDGEAKRFREQKSKQNDHV